MHFSRHSLVLVVSLVAATSLATADSGPLSPITTFQGNPALSSVNVVRDALDGGSFHPTKNWVAVSDNATTTRIFDLDALPGAHTNILELSL